MSIHVFKNTLIKTHTVNNKIVKIYKDNKKVYL